MTIYQVASGALWVGAMAGMHFVHVIWRIVRNRDLLVRVELQRVAMWRMWLGLLELPAICVGVLVPVEFTRSWPIGLIVGAVAPFAFAAAMTPLAFRRFRSGWVDPSAFVHRRPLYVAVTFLALCAAWSVGHLASS